MKLDKLFFEYSCTKCGFCKEIYPDNFNFDKNFFSLNKNLSSKQNKIFYDICPATGFDYTVKKKNVKFSNLIGNYIDNYAGYSLNNINRYKAASGGIITETLLYLLKTQHIDYVVMPITNKNNYSNPYYTITNKTNVIKENSQSIYFKIPVENILKNLNKDMKIAFVGLPDQISSFRKILEKKIIKLKKIIFIGPMVGINMDKNSLDGIRLSFNINKEAKLKYLKWREGKWPGYLKIKFENYKTIIISKFYYNFLLPFYCSHETLLSCDFSNEDSDISVGDAWSPVYETPGAKGISLISTKSLVGQKIINELYNRKKIYISKVSFNDAIKMHAHMLDFKKRGSQYRKKIYEFMGIVYPKNKIKIVKFNFSRFIIEVVILLTIFVCRSFVGKIILILVSPKILGFVFKKLRYTWKSLTIKIKRKELNKF